MRLPLKLAWPVMILACSLQALLAQDLSPRAFAITPDHSNAINLTYAFFTGSILFDGAIPKTSSSGFRWVDADD